MASTGDNEIFAIPDAKDRTTDAGMGGLVVQDNVHLHGPLGLLLAPNGDLITANGDAVNPDPNQQSEIAEFTPDGQFVGQIAINPAAGAVFGIALQFAGPDTQVRFAAVDDATNTVHVWNIDLDGKSDEGSSSSASRGEHAENTALFASLARDQGDAHSQVIENLIAARLEPAVRSLSPSAPGVSVEHSGLRLGSVGPLVRSSARPAVDGVFSDLYVELAIRSS